MACKKNGSMDDAINKCIENMNYITKQFSTVSGNMKEYSVEVAARDFAFSIAEVYIGRNMFGCMLVDTNYHVIICFL